MQAHTKLTKFIKVAKILELASIGRTTLWRLVKAGKFPPPIRIGPNSVAWRESDYQAWADNPESWSKNNKAVT